MTTKAKAATVDTPAEEEDAPLPVADFDPKDIELATLRTQVESLEDFLNIVIGQRNDAQNQAAQYQSQLLKLRKQQGS